MVPNRDEPAITPEELAAVAVGKFAFEAGLLHGEMLKSGGTSTGNAVVEQAKGHFWIAAYDVALQSFLTNRRKNDIAANILAATSEILTNLLPDFLEESESPEEMREQILFGNPDKPIPMLATELAAYHVGMYAANIGTRYGIIHSDWRPLPSIWVEAFETAREAAILAAQERMSETESGRLDVDELHDYMTFLAVEATFRVLLPLEDRLRMEFPGRVGRTPDPAQQHRPMGTGAAGVVTSHLRGSSGRESRQMWRSNFDYRSEIASPKRQAAAWRHSAGRLLYGAAFVLMAVNWLAMVAFIFIHFGGWGFLALMLTPMVTGLLGTPIMLIVYDAPVLAVITWVPMVISFVVAAIIKPDDP